MDENDDLLLKEHEGIKIHVSPITGTFSCIVFEEEYNDTDLWKLQELITQLHTKKANMEEVFVEDYLYDLITGRIKSYDYSRVYVESDNTARTNEHFDVKKVYPANDKNREIYEEIKEIRREIRDYERKKKTEIHKLMNGLDTYPEDHFRKKVLEQKKVKKE
jgi:hypothetical protein